MSVSAHDVARELRGRLGADLGQTKLQKLLFLVQAWHVTWRGEALFHEEIQAYPNGPVVHEFRADEMHANRQRPAPAEVPDGGVIDLVVSNYGHMTKAALIIETHTFSCWRNARIEAGDDLTWLQADPLAESWQDGNGIPSLPINVEAMVPDIRATPTWAAHENVVERHRAAMDRFRAPLEQNYELQARIEEAIGL